MADHNVERTAMMVYTHAVSGGGTGCTQPCADDNWGDPNAYLKVPGGACGLC